MTRMLSCVLIAAPLAFYATGLAHITHTHDRFDPGPESMVRAALHGSACTHANSSPADVPAGSSHDRHGPTHDEQNCPVCHFITHSAAVQVAACSDLVVDSSFQFTRAPDSSQVDGLVTALPVRVPRAPPIIL